MTFQHLGVATAVGAVAIVVLVGLAWRTLSRRGRARTRPASPEAADSPHPIDHDRLDALRKIAAADYARRTKDRV
jgi:hypothetical protein